MKVIDIISESKQAHISKRQSQASRGISIYSDAERANSDYVAFKLGQAMAGSDIGDDHKEIFAGENALKAGDASKNTMNQFAAH
jgi:isocitrate lyase